MHKILIVDTDEDLIDSLDEFLSSNSFEVISTTTIKQALEILQYEKISAMVVDYDLNATTPTPLTDLNLPILIMANSPSMRSVSLASSHPCAEYIAKPVRKDFVLRLIDKLIKGKPNDKQTGGALQNLSNWDLLRLSAKSENMQNLLDAIQKIAVVDSKVLILGESGTGKELVATSIHQLSKRKNKPIMSINCAAIPHLLLESELFGYEKGAFTGASARKIGLVEAAEGGSLFLDEIGELPLNVQASLLRLLQEGEIRRLGSNETHKVDVRIIAATNQNLKELVAKGQFRLDLYYRLNVITLQIPSLINRQDDIIDLSNILLRRLSEKLNLRLAEISEATKFSIRSHIWEGNIRELENRLERGLILCKNNSIQPEDMNLKLKHRNTEQAFTNLDAGLDIFAHSNKMQEVQNMEQKNLSNRKLSLEEYFVHFVLENQCDMNETQLAKALGISRKALWEKRQKHRIARGGEISKKPLGV